MDPVKQQVVTMQPPPPPAPQPVAQPAKGMNVETLKRIYPLVMFGLMVVFSIVFLSGVAASQARCSDLNNPWLAFPTGLVSVPKDDPQNPQGVGPFADHQVLLALPNAAQDVAPAISTISVAAQCRNEYSFPWWIVWFQLMLLGVAIFKALRPEALVRFNMAIVILFAMVTGLLMYICSVFNQHVWLLTMAMDYMNSDRFKNDPQFAVKSERLDQIRGTTKKFQSATQAAMAGVVVLILMNLVYIVLASDSELMPVIALPATNNNKKKTNTAQKNSGSGRKASQRAASNIDVRTTSMKLDLTPSANYVVAGPPPLSQDLPPIVMPQHSPHGSYTAAMQQHSPTTPPYSGMQQAYAQSPQRMQQVYGQSPQGAAPRVVYQNGQQVHHAVVQQGYAPAGPASNGSVVQQAQMHPQNAAQP